MNFKLMSFELMGSHIKESKHDLWGTFSFKI